MIKEITKQRLRVISNILSQYPDSNTIPPDTRIEISMLMQIALSDFVEFCYLGMRYLGFSLTEMQADIAHFMAKGMEEYRKEGYSGVVTMAQRGEAKSTIAAFYVLWRLIQECFSRVLIVSAGEAQANEISTLCIRLIENWKILSYLKADKSKGDRTSVEHYDVHYVLKGMDKSPSIACVGITANLAGKRADVLLADDIENDKNGYTHTQREEIQRKTKEFSAICTHGDILYLGTPHSKNSIYNKLPARGFKVRIWPGRIPSEEQQERYGDKLAPYVVGLIEKGMARTGFGLDGTLGESTDTGRYSEEDLIKKELDRGPEDFALQYMLDTSLSDDLRTKVKLKDFIVYAGDVNAAPSSLSWCNDKKYTSTESLDHPHCPIRMYLPSGTSEVLVKYQHKLLVIDPAGAGGDEVSYCAGGAASSYIHIFSAGGFAGGCTNENLEKIVDLAVDMGITDILVESNIGHGTVESLIINKLTERRLTGIGVRGIYNTKNKERRIIDTISPVARKHKLVLHTRVFEDDEESSKVYAPYKRSAYSLFTQINDITYDAGCLQHDDRLDALSILIQELNLFLIEDERLVVEKQKRAEAEEFMRNPMGYSEMVLQQLRRNTGKVAKGTRGRLRHR